MTSRLAFQTPVSIETHAKGSLQEATYKNPELYDEYIGDPWHSPLDECVYPTNDLHVMRYFIFGDKDAGKSSFLYQFVNFDDKNFTKLQNIVPQVGSIFQNFQFPPLVRGSNQLFDTELGYTRVLLSSEALTFFGQEYGADFSLKRNHTMLDFTEVGSDLFDRLVDPLPSQPSSEKLVQMTKAEDGIKLTSKILYFINCRELLTPRRLKQIEDRLDFCQWMREPQETQVIFFLCRFSEATEDGEEPPNPEESYNQCVEALSELRLEETIHLTFVRNETLTVVDGSPYLHINPPGFAEALAEILKNPLEVDEFEAIRSYLIQGIYASLQAEEVLQPSDFFKKLSRDEDLIYPLGALKYQFDVLIPELVEKGACSPVDDGYSFNLDQPTVDRVLQDYRIESLDS